jgi:hypothetical protein
VMGKSSAPVGAPAGNSEHQPKLQTLTSRKGAE